MSEPESDRPNVRIHPPTVFLLALIAGYFIRVFTSGYFPLPQVFSEGVGGALMLASVSLLLAAAQAFFESGEALKPATPSGQLFTKGPYRYSRNPIYLAFMMFGVGFSFATSNSWILLTTALAGLVLHFFVILPEEEYLSRRFGEDYQAYRKIVRRWI